MNSEMFKNYPQPDGYIPFNRPVKKPAEINTIVSGGFCSNFFKVKLPFDENIKGLKVIYKQEFRLYMEKIPTVVKENEKSFIVEVKFNNVESKQFGGTLLDTYAQVEVTYGDNMEQIFTPKVKINVVNTLKEELLDE